MFFLSKKQIFNIFFASALILSISVNFFPSAETKETAAPPISGKVIVLDAGHGSPDGGGVGISGVLEKDLNLKITKLVGNYLTQSGAKVIYTREDDNSIADDLTKKLREIKRSDLKNRKEIKNNSGADLFISIHMNKFDQPQYKGAQVFYQKGSEESKKLAENIQEKIKAFADAENSRVAKSSDKSIFLLNDSSITSALVECGFLSNPQEEKKLQSKRYQEEIAFAIFSGINEYISNL